MGRGREEAYDKESGCFCLFDLWAISTKVWILTAVAKNFCAYQESHGTACGSYRIILLNVSCGTAAGSHLHILAWLFVQLYEIELGKGPWTSLGPDSLAWDLQKPLEGLLELQNQRIERVEKDL